MAPATAAGASRLAKLLTALASPRTAVVNRGWRAPRAAGTSWMIRADPSPSRAAPISVSTRTEDPSSRAPAICPVMAATSATRWPTRRTKGPPSSPVSHQRDREQTRVEGDLGPADPELLLQRGEYRADAVEQESQHAQRRVQHQGQPVADQRGGWRAAWGGFVQSLHKELR